MSRLQNLLQNLTPVQINIIVIISFEIATNVETFTCSHFQNATIDSVQMFLSINIFYKITSLKIKILIEFE